MIQLPVRFSSGELCGEVYVSRAKRQSLCPIIPATLVQSPYKKSTASASKAEFQIPRSRRKDLFAPLSVPSFSISGTSVFRFPDLDGRSLSPYFLGFSVWRTERTELVAIGLPVSNLLKRWVNNGPISLWNVPVVATWTQHFRNLF